MWAHCLRGGVVTRHYPAVVTALRVAGNYVAVMFDGKAMLHAVSLFYMLYYRPTGGFACLILLLYYSQNYTKSLHKL